MPLAQWVRLALFFSSASSSRLAFPPLILIPLEFSRCDHRTFSFQRALHFLFISYRQECKRQNGFR